MPTIFETFKVFRDYIEHEDGLISSRITWLTVSQSFLFVSFAQLIGTSFEVASTPADREISRIYITMICLLGCTLCILTFLSVWAATRAINDLQNKWSDLKKEYLFATPDEYFLLPNLTGGTRRRTTILGFSSAIFMPAAFLLAWTTAAYFLWYDYLPEYLKFFQITVKITLEVIEKGKDV